MTTLLNFPVRKSQPRTPVGHATGLNLRELLPRGSCFPVVGRLHGWQFLALGQAQASLRVSFGTVQIRSNRESWPDLYEDGTWVRVKLMNGHNDDSAMTVIGLAATAPAPDETAWVARARVYHPRAMLTLRRLLAKLEPALQGFFMSLMLDASNESQLLSRPAATTHHCYPTGLFDQSVAAACLASEGWYDSKHDHDLAMLAALIFDIGKASDPQLRKDGKQRRQALQPHPSTLSILQRPLQRLATSHPGLASEIAEVLADGAAGPHSPRMALVRSQVRLAVLGSFKLHRPDRRADVTRLNKGEQA